MIDVSTNASGILQTYKDDYVFHKTPQEYGSSAFWNWYYQILDNFWLLYRT